MIINFKIFGEYSKKILRMLSVNENLPKLTKLINK